ncbi:MAG TPA: hypothetical protein GX011_06040 [Clostridiales bacterium]|jgi:hypothetical protein|nr:hypothetical protein [Clostridiales bacterium]
MDTAGGVDIERLRQLNRPGYARTRLTIIYIILFAFAACAGAFFCWFFFGSLPKELTARISATLLPPPAGRLTVGLLYDIIYNSVDIFKISFIILIAGFTYISGLIDRILLFFSGMFYGLSTSLCIDLLRGGQVYEGEGGFLVTVLFIFRMLVLCSVIISGGIVSELYSTYWRFHRNTYSLLKSWYFWKYNLVFLILFGYVILAEFGYRILLNIIL